jgi:hypothetical protein
MKIRNKLILSCAALAAVATTAVSTTFAWYTANTEVSATGLTAKTDNNGADTLLISKTGEAGTWSSAIAFTDAAQVLSPVEYTAGESNAKGTYKAWNAATDAVGAANSGAANVKQYTFWLKDQTATEATTVYVSALTAAFAPNEGDSLPTKDVLNTTGLGTLNSAAYTGKTYTVSLQRALDMEVAVEQVAGVANSDDENAPAATAVSANVFGFDYFSSISDSLTGRTGWNAHEYYNAVKGLPITGGNSAISTSDPLTVSQLGGNATTKWDLLSANPANIYKVTITLFVNGWDLACFDAVQGQKVTVGFKFATTDGTTVKKGATGVANS